MIFIPLSSAGFGENTNAKHAITYLFIYLGFYVASNTVQGISRRVVGRTEETLTYSLSGFCTVNCRPTASNYQLSHLSESVTTLPLWPQNMLLPPAIVWHIPILGKMHNIQHQLLVILHLPSKCVV